MKQIVLAVVLWVVLVGCTPIETNNTTTQPPLNLEKNPCTPESRQGEYCTMEYNPVCGWFDENINCIKYPCAQTFGNSCAACHDAKVAYWTQGECPN
ncbi:hypothetical protein HZB01_04430 [Candidatus Woesearchaeota archaeon]|nr:hypothetical protein [Candidatus Woesearchaeota archaeon]